jgi:hypothetical protein
METSRLEKAGGRSDGKKKFGKLRGKRPQRRDKSPLRVVRNVLKGTLTWSTEEWAVLEGRVSWFVTIDKNRCRRCSRCCCLWKDGRGQARSARLRIKLPRSVDKNARGNSRSSMVSRESAKMEPFNKIGRRSTRKKDVDASAVSGLTNEESRARVSPSVIARKMKSLDASAKMDH